MQRKIRNFIKSEGGKVPIKNFIGFLKREGYMVKPTFERHEVLGFRISEGKMRARVIELKKK